MNNLLYARLAKTNLSKNRQNILPYLLSCIGTVVMFFIMDTLAQGSGFDSMIGKDTILTVMGMGTYIIGLFAVIFLIYSNSFLAKRRKKEFGLFQILGMEKKHLAKILFFESLYLCRQIMEKLSHTIRIESERGVGTKVYLGLDTVSL